MRRRARWRPSARVTALSAVASTGVACAASTVPLCLSYALCLLSVHTSLSCMLRRAVLSLNASVCGHLSHLVDPYNWNMVRAIRLAAGSARPWAWTAGMATNCRDLLCDLSHVQGEFAHVALGVGVGDWLYSENDFHLIRSAAAAYGRECVRRWAGGSRADAPLVPSASGTQKYVSAVFFKAT